MKEGWEYRQFESCLVKVPKQVQVKSKDYKKEGKFPIVSQEAELISGYWDDETIVYKPKEPVVIFGDHTKNIKYVDFDFVVGADGTHILRTKNDIYSKFFYYVLKSIKLRQLGYARHYKLLKEKFIPVPPLYEQQSIVDYFDSAFAKIDAMKANAEKALNEAQALFQASLKEMLEPKEGWEEKKFGDVCWYNKKNGLHKGTRYVGMEHIEQGTGRLLCTISSDDVLSNTFAFNKGDVLYGRLRPYLKKVIVAGFEGCCSTEIFPIQSKEIISSFLMYWFLTDEITNKVNATCAGCRMPRGNMNDVLKFDISYPSISEQQSIVATLDSLKSKVDRLQENYDKISQECDALKQAILRQVFE